MVSKALKDHLSTYDPVAEWPHPIGFRHTNYKTVPAQILPRVNDLFSFLWISFYLFFIYLYLFLISVSKCPVSKKKSYFFQSKLKIQTEPQ